jgi:Flp pilus assembly protein TadG
MYIRRNSKHDSREGERGQVLILCVICIVVLLLFVGLAIDFGMAYVAKAQLGKAADAASLAAARYSGLGQTQAQALAQSAFNMNYGTSSLGYSAAPVVTITPTQVTTGVPGTLWTVNVSATNQTSFLGILPGFSILNVASASQSKAARVVMTLLLDRTGSMVSEDDGSVYLGPAVSNFITYFDDTHDVVASVSFANDQTVDVPMPANGTLGNFKQNVTNAANNLLANGRYAGGTFSDGGLQTALAVENAYVPPAGTTPQKAIVFFTDGNANTVEGALTCTGRSSLQSGIWNFGGTDTNTQVLFLSTNNNAYQNPNNCPSNTNGPVYPLNSNPTSVCGWETSGTTTACNGNFTTVSNTSLPLTWTNVTSDARARAVADANAMRALGITVYAIGLGNAFTAVDSTFLCQVANDPCSPSYDSTQPVGAMEYAASGALLDQAFQTVAGIIRMRLTQ